MNAAAAIYPVVVTFSQTFTRGALDGMTITNQQRHIDVKHAESWVVGVTKYAKRNGYTISNVVISEG